MDGTETKQEQPPSEYMSVTEVAELLHVKVTTVRRWIASGKLPAMTGPRGRGGGEWQVRREIIAKWLAEGAPKHEYDRIDKAARCQAVRADGKPCRALALKGTRFCRKHKLEPFREEIARHAQERQAQLRQEIAAQAAARAEATADASGVSKPTVIRAVGTNVPTQPATVTGKDEAPQEGQEPKP